MDFFFLTYYHFILIVPLRYERVKVNETDTAHLGAWLATQRREHLNGKMRPERLELLQKLVNENMLEWAPLNHSKQSEQTWPLMYECLRMYCLERQKEHPGVEVSSIPETKTWTHPDGWEVGLGRWMHTQNKQRRAGKLRPDRCEKMEELVTAGMFRWPTQRNLSNSAKAKKAAAAAAAATSNMTGADGATGKGKGTKSRKRATPSVAANTLPPPPLHDSNNPFNDVVGESIPILDESHRGKYTKRAKTSKVQGGSMYRSGDMQPLGAPSPGSGFGGMSSSFGIDMMKPQYSSAHKGGVNSRPNNATHGSSNPSESGLSVNFSRVGGMPSSRLANSAFLGSLYSQAVPIASLQYARELASNHIVQEANQTVPKADHYNVIFPLPTLHKVPQNNGRFAANALPTTKLELGPNAVPPLSMPVKRTDSAPTLTNDLKKMIEAQFIAYLKVSIAEDNPHREEMHADIDRAVAIYEEQKEANNDD